VTSTTAQVGTGTGRQADTVCRQFAAQQAANGMQFNANCLADVVTLPLPDDQASSGVDDGLSDRGYM